MGNISPPVHIEDMSHTQTIKLRNATASLKYMTVNIITMKSDTVTISRQEYEKLKMQAEVDVELLKQLMESFRDIKEGRIRKVK